MKKLIACVLALFVLLSFETPVFAAEIGTAYYVDMVNGDDSNSGRSPDSAKKTLSSVSEKEYSEGDRILFHCGQTFEGNFIAKGSGTKENPILFSSYGEGARPCIKGSSSLPAFIAISTEYWTVDNIDFTNENGGGLTVYAASGDAVGITVSNCSFHDISIDNDDLGNSSIYVDNLANCKVRDLHICNVEISNTCWGIHVKGINAENSGEYFISPEESYNSGFLFENLRIVNASNGGIVLGCMTDSVVKNSSVINCATKQGSAYAPLWLRHSKNVLIEYCEIAGSTNRRDGMAIDFDGWTTDCTYDHIYSHDNNRFIKNCVFDAKTRNRGNKVTNCISVNDSKRINMSAVSLISTSAPSFSFMKDFTFTDNTIVNGSPIIWLCTPFARNNNNTFIGSFTNTLAHRFSNLFVRSKGNSYENAVSDEVQNAIDDIVSHAGGR